MNGHSDTELIYAVITLGAAAVTLACSRREGRGSAGWSLLGLGLLLWGASGLANSMDVIEPTPKPTMLDAAELAAYPLILFGLARLVESRIRHMPATAWIDALIGALCVTTLGSTLLIDYLGHALTGSSIEVSIQITFPILDLLLLAAGAGAIALTGWRPGPALAIVAAGAMAMALGDAASVYESVEGKGGLSVYWSALFPVGAVLVAVGALQKPSATRRGVAHSSGWRALASPSIFAVAVLAFELIARPQVGGWLIEALTMLTLIAIVARLTLTYGENRRLVGLLQKDALTGLGNRSKLSVDLKDLLLDTDEPAPHVLTMLDLDGFKSYNDAFGHPAGDALLSRLAGQLRAVISGKGHAYRLGGDEFAVLAPGGDEETSVLIERCSAALTEHGEGFKITSSYGTTELPREVDDPDRALQIADQRMYEHKDSRRPTPMGEVQAVVLRILQQRAPDLGRHGDAVSTLAVAIGEEMGLGPSELSALARAAELHDVGKVAIPDAILNKPGALDDEEWEFMRQHTVLGARILGAAASLAPLGQIVRSSHERWDGKGYPDGLAGVQIPLASRIVFVCDAYDAMIQKRPYAPPMSTDQALAELQRCAGTQFDPHVVEAFMRLVRSVREAQTGGAKATNGAGPDESEPQEEPKTVVRASEDSRAAIADVVTEEFEWIEPDPDSELGKQRAEEAEEQPRPSGVTA